MPDHPPDKTRLRRQLRARRSALTAARQQSAARAVAAALAAFPPWQQARRIALYLPADGEIDTLPLALLARRDGKQLFLPVIGADNSLSFALWEEHARLGPNRFGIPEPPPGTPQGGPDGLDIICLPLVGWDRRGGRLGMGGGFYDRTLAGIEGPLLIGLAHTCQELDRVPLEAWDVRLDWVATDAALHDCRGHSGSTAGSIPDDDARL
jgi:5-formyltetrahydrofolate cyclo-ligase